jgi:hypothetical protein
MHYALTFGFAVVLCGPALYALPGAAWTEQIRVSSRVLSRVLRKCLTMLAAITVWVARKLVDFFWIPGAQSRENEADASLVKDGHQTGTFERI